MKKEDIYKHWVGMPEYDNKQLADALITVTLKFKTQEDFEEFNRLLKTEIYQCNKVFDGMQRKTKKQAWFPLLEKGSDYEYK